MFDKRQLLETYLGEVAQAVEIRELPDGAAVATAELLRDGSRATVWVRWPSPKADTVTVHDNGYCVDHLSVLGFQILGTEHRSELALEICRSYGVRLEGGVVRSTCRLAEVGATMLRVGSAIHSISDLVYTKQAYSERPTLAAEVADYVRRRTRLPIEHRPRVKGEIMSHAFDLAVRNGKLNYVRVMSGAGLTQVAQRWVFTWWDIRRVKRDAPLFVVYDSKRDQWSKPAVRIVNEYSTGAFDWVWPQELVQTLEEGE